MDQPTTSANTGESQPIKLENIGTDTIMMIKRMIWKLKLEQHQPTSDLLLSDPVLRTMKYTGMTKFKIEKRIASGDFDYNIYDINQLVIHKEVRVMFFKNQIPTITELFIAVADKLPVYVNLDYFIQILIKMGYVFYKFPKQKSLRVMEKKSIVFERYRYLKNIIQCRESNAPIVYIGIFSIGAQEIFSLERTLQTDPKDLVLHVLFTANQDSIENIKIMSPSNYQQLQEGIREWFIELFVLKNVPTGSVCVLDDSKIFREKLINIPTWKSVKADMVEWLEDHNISCNTDMCKADLLQLIETCTDTTKNPYIYDNLITAQNYTVLRLPQSINGLSIAASVVSLIKGNDGFKPGASRLTPSVIFGMVNENDLKLFSKSLQLEEKKLLMGEKRYDYALDVVIRKVKTPKNKVQDTEDDTILPVFSDSE